MNLVKNNPLHVVFSTLYLVLGHPDETLSRVYDTLHDMTIFLKLRFKKSRWSVLFSRSFVSKAGSWHVLSFNFV